MTLLLYKFSQDFLALRSCNELSPKKISLVEHENSKIPACVYEENFCKLTSPFETICYLMETDSSSNDAQQLKSLQKSILRPFFESSIRSSGPIDSSSLDQFFLKISQFKDPKCKVIGDILLWAEIYPIIATKSPKLSEKIQKVYDEFDVKLSKCIPNNFLKDFLAKIDIPFKAKGKESEPKKKETQNKNVTKVNVQNKPKPPSSNVQAIPEKEVEFEIIKIDIDDKDRQFSKENFKPIKLEKKFLSVHPRLPVKDRRNILVTSALPYVNNVPHLGNLIGSTLSAHVYSVYAKMIGHNCLSICGTDEYGTATETKAQAEKKTPKEICDQYNALHNKIYDWFEIDFDYFGRTTTPIHNEITHEIFGRLQENGFISENSVEQLYCQNCSNFLADRFVSGICPLCKYDDARGDQCDKCGRIINAIDLKEPKCKICASSPISRTSNHLFLDLPKIENDLKAFLDARQQSKDSLWSTNSITISKSWLRDGLKSRCITRDLKWGVPVPVEKMKPKVFYVWFDAPIGYISITSNYLCKHNGTKEDWRKWWQAKNVELYQFMAKDNVPFHAIIFPSTMLASKHEFVTVKQILSTEYMNYENTKFSKSRNIGVFGDDAMSSGIHSDIWRFYLISIRPESQDSAFSWNDFMLRNNSELLNNLGNYINRAMSFVAKFFDGVIPKMESLDEEDLTFIAKVNRLFSDYLQSMETCKLRDASRIILQISGQGNGYIQSKKPWVSMKKEDEKQKASTCIGIAANIVPILALVLKPMMPKISKEIWNVQCNLALEDMTFENFLLQIEPPKNCTEKIPTKIPQLMPSGHKIGKTNPIFRKLEKAEIDSLSDKYGKRV